MEQDLSLTVKGPLASLGGLDCGNEKGSWEEVIVVPWQLQDGVLLGIAGSGVRR